MSRFEFEKAGKSKGVDPIWQGVGFLVFIAMTVGGYLLMGWIIDLNAANKFLPFPLPTAGEITLYEDIAIPARIFMQVGATLVLDIILFALFTIIFGIVSPEKPEPTDINYRGRR